MSKFCQEIIDEKDDSKQIEEKILQMAEEVKRSRRNQSENRRDRSGSSRGRLHKGYFQQGEKIDENVFHNDLKNAAVVDSGCPKPVMGKPWFKIYKSGLNHKRNKGGEIESKQTNEKFKFGDGPVYK